MSVLGLVDMMILILREVGRSFTVDDAVLSLTKQFILAGEPLREEQIEELRQLAEIVERGNRWNN